MWGEFAAAVCLVCALLYLPGFVALRAVGLARIDALAGAPALAVFACTLAGSVCGLLDIRCSWEVLAAASVLCALFVSAVAVLAKRVAGRNMPRVGDTAESGDSESSEGGASLFSASSESSKRDNGSVSRRASRRALAFGVACVAAYCVIGLSATCLFFAGTLDGPDSYVQEYDNLHHLGATRGFAEAGLLDALDDTLYPTPAEVAVNPLPGRTVYPQGWNCLAGFAADALGASPALAGNAVNFVILAFVLPLGALSLLRTLFVGSRETILLGALCPLAFTAFPWALLIFGPLYPNLLAFSLIPASAGCFVRLFTARRRRSDRLADGLGFLLGFAALVLTQTNAVFTLGLWVAPYLVSRVASLADGLAIPVGRRRLLGVVFGAFAVCGICAVWLVCFNAPFLESVVWYDWPAFESVPSALADIVSLGFRIDVPQWLLALFVFAGIAATFFERRLLWLTAAFAASCMICLVSMAVDGYAKHLLAGFWYTDSTRVAAMTALFAIPLAALGLGSIHRCLLAAIRRVRSAVSPSGERVPAPAIRGGGACAGPRAGRSAVEGGGGAPSRVLSGTCAALLSLAFVLSVFWPFHLQDPQDPQRTAFGAVAGSLSMMNDADEPRVYDPQEEEFVREVQAMLPEGEMVLNYLDDGSAFAYAVDGLNAYYRYMWTYGSPSETPESLTIRHGLANVADSAEVRDALKRIGACYLLLLDYGAMTNKGQGESELGNQPDPHRRWLFSYLKRGDTWDGIERVDDATPGFTVVAARGDMRLYRIEGI